MKVYKYGGNILKDRQTRESIYKKLKNENEKIVIVVSAFKEGPYSTDTLDLLINECDNQQVYDRIVSIGELISSCIIYKEMKQHLFNCDILFVEELGIKVKKTNNEIDEYYLDNTKLLEKLEHTDVLICPGFVAMDTNDAITTLNRGGSDLSAVLIAKMLNSSSITFYKDVEGVGLCDPKLFENKKVLKNVSYEKMILFSKHGSNLLQLESLKKAKEFNIPLYIKHYAQLGSGTLINDKKGDSSLNINIKNKKVYIDGYSNSDYIKHILFNNYIEYEQMMTFNDSIEILSKNNNEMRIYKTICYALFRS